MKHLLLVVLLLMAGSVFSQKDIQLKKKYQGYYEGEIPGYSVQSNGELHFVSSTKISITIGEDFVQVRVGKNEIMGSYEVMFKAEKYFLLDVDIEGQLANERIMVYKKGKKLSRDGMFPQPVTTLKKIKKKNR
ncbi:MAG: hypothetical protein DCO96_02075 [Fluviicola sp. XM-24bin1]|nr:MAG: hypothetical protein DCO96_02075 [Fluviicola sp. XM-24bin1]